MKISDLTTPLHEAPLPPDWEKEKFSPATSHAARIRYAVAQAQKKVGAGSGRVAVQIPYEGRPTILKVAKNKKGLAQNEFEARMLDDGYVETLGITIPMIDHDQENDPPVWIHTEMAEKMTAAKFRKLFNISHTDFHWLLMYANGEFPNIGHGREAWFQELMEENDYVASVVDLVTNFGIPPGDFGRTANWGIFKGRPVIVDLGLSSDVLQQHYGG